MIFIETLPAGVEGAGAAAISGAAASGAATDAASTLSGVGAGDGAATSTGAAFKSIRDITKYIEIFYNRQRRQAALGYLSPAAFARKLQEQQLGKAA